MSKKFIPKSRLTDVAKNILPQRYLHPDETKWRHVAERMVRAICSDWDEDSRSNICDFLYNRYGVPNSPLIANAGKSHNAGYSACFVVPFEDTTEDIYKTKYNFALVARAGGGCGTTLSNIRPQGDPVAGSSHDYAGGAIPFADTISHDMTVFTQGGFREMALMFTMRYDHPDILKFITAKTDEGKIPNANISVFATDEFMRKVENEETYWTHFNGKKYKELNAREVFDAIVDGAWHNGEPGILFDDRINESPYKYDNVKIEATNP